MKRLADKEANSSWRDFLRELSGFYHLADRDSAASNQLTGRRYTWQGTVIENRFVERYATGLMVKMPLIGIPLRDGNELVVDHLFLPIADANEVAIIKKIRVGSPVTFEATVAPTQGPFEPVSYLVDEEQKKVFLEVALTSICILQPKLEAVR